jgi:hypothetical protein
MATVSDRPRAVQRRRPVRPAHGVARLTLHINSVAYAVRPLWCDGVHASRLFRLRKAGTPARYVVAETPDGPVCDCPDFTFHHEGIDPDGCKHIKAMVAVGLIAGRKEVAR